MPKNKHSHIFHADIKDVFSRFTNAVLLDFNQKSTTFNTSYTQPIGTEFKYVEHSFGQDITYVATITEYEKPHIFSYCLKNKKTSLNIIWDFKSENDTTIVSLSIILENPSFFQYFSKRSLFKQQKESFKKYISYCEKTL